MLDALEEFAQDKLQGVDLASIEWYHRIRNQLYHQGYGLSVDREKVEVYVELANALFKNLFGATAIEQRKEDTELLGRFIQLWPRLESALADISSDHTLTAGRPRTLLHAVRFLREGHILPQKELDEIEMFRKLRNEVIHGTVDYKQVLNEETVNRLEQLVCSLEEDTGKTQS
ncbi:MAG: hypothetical protein HY313_01950 [Acidobacteria bacterium]|nr:hypothetical protein [Acidobacteriota bacterium]